MKRYAWNILVAIDQLANALFGGDPDETLSSRCGKRVSKCRLCRWLCQWLERIDPGHCQQSIEKDEGSNAAFPD